MMNARKKIVKEKGAATTPIEDEVAKALFDIDVSGAKEMEVRQGRSAVVVHFPYRIWKNVRKIHGRLVRELEKKFSHKHVVFVANRTILDKNFRRKGLKVR